MNLRPFAFALLVSGPVVAQQPPLEVTDLLLPDARHAARDARAMVQRGLAHLESDESRGLRHRVSGEGHLVPWSSPFADSDFEQGGAFTEDALATALARIRGAGGSTAGFNRSGDRVYVDTEYAEQVASALTQVRRAQPPRVSVEVQLERIGADSSEILLTGVESFRNGETRVLADVIQRQVVFDFDVEIAQSSAVANPVVGEVTHGASVALRARAIPLEDGVVVEAVVRVGAPMPGDAIQPSKWLGPFDRVSTRIDEAGLSFRLQRGELSQHEWTTREGDRLRLTCVAEWEPAQVDVGRELMIVASPMFGAPVLGFRSTTGGEPEDYTECAPIADLLEQLYGATNSEAMTLFPSDSGRGTGVLLLEGDRGRRVAQALAARIGAALRGGTVTVQVLDAPAGVDVASTGALPDGVREVARFAGPSLLGLPLCFASAAEASYVGDWDVEVAQSSRIPDPKVSMLEDGWFATVRAVGKLVDAPARVEVALQLRELRELRSVSTSISAESIALTDASQSVMLPQEVVDLELPVIGSLQVATTLDLDDQGAAVLRRAATAIFGPGRALVVRVRVE